MSQIDQYVYELTKKLAAISLKSILIRMFNVVKKSKWIVLLLICLGVLQLYRNRTQFVTWQAEALGKPYQVQYWIRQGANHRIALAALLEDLYQTVKVGSGESRLEQFNQYNCDAFYLAKPFLYHLVDKSKIAYKATNGVFDPTVAPLVKLWKDASAKGVQPDSDKIRDLRAYVGLDYIVVNNERIKKLKERVTLDVSGLLHGYAIDTIANFLKDHGTQDLCISMGRLTLAYGKQPKKQGWSIQESLPIKQDNMDTLGIETMLCDQAMVIKQHGEEGDAKKMTLIIDPHTGYPGQHTLLAVIVFAKQAVMADAYATAMLAKGIEFAKDLAQTQKDVEVCIVYQHVLGHIAYYVSDGLSMEQESHSKHIRLSCLGKNTTDGP